MHELSVTQSIVDTVVREGKKAGAAKVLKVGLVMGTCSCLMTEIVRDYFSLLSEGTIAEHAELEITKLPGKVKCRDCGAETEIPDFRMICPLCHSRNTELTQGREFYLSALEIEDPDE